MIKQEEVGHNEYIEEEEEETSKTKAPKNKKKSLGDAQKTNTSNGQ